MNNTNSTINQNPLGDSSHVGMWYWTLRWAIGIVTLLGNGLIILIIILRRRLHIATNWLILSLATADFLVGFFLIPGAYFCNFYLVCDWSILYAVYDLLLYVSVLNLSAITAERFIAVVYPYSYERLMTTNNIRVLVAGAWGLPTILCIIPISWKDSEKSKQQQANKAFRVASLVLIEIIPCVAMLIIHIPIFIIVRRHMRQINMQRQNLQPQVDQEKRKFLKNQKREKSTVKVIALVVLLFVFCYLMVVYRSVCWLFRLCRPPFEVLLASRILLLLNSAINPFFYALMKRDIRRELFAVLRSCRGLGRTAPEPQENDSSSVTGNNGMHSQSLSVMNRDLATNNNS